MIPAAIAGVIRSVWWMRQKLYQVELPKLEYNQGVAEEKNPRELPNITVPREAFDNLLGKLLKAKPLPKSAIPPKRAHRKSDRREQQPSGPQGR